MAWGTLIYHLAAHGPSVVERVRALLPSWWRLVIVAPEFVLADLPKLPDTEPHPRDDRQSPMEVAQAWMDDSEIVVFGCDDGLLIVPDNLPPADEGVGVWLYGGLKGAMAPLYPSNRFNRPDNYLCGVALTRTTLDVLEMSPPLRFDRWLPHRVALAALSLHRPIGLIEAGFASLASPAQPSGFAINRGRVGALAVFEQGLAAPDTLGLDAPWAEAAQNSLASAATIVQADLSRQPMPAVLRTAIDDCAGQVTSAVFAGVVRRVQAPTSALCAAPDRLAVLPVGTARDAIFLMPLLRAARAVGCDDIRVVSYDDDAAALLAQSGLADRTSLPFETSDSGKFREWMSRYPDQGIDVIVERYGDALEGVDLAVLPLLSRIRSVRPLRRY